jgi:ElaB/YqjD/DUF883 family membrane-anchored ribosome-binding protein
MYDYYEAVKEDILTYVKENVDMENIDYDFDELREKLNEELYTVDSVTGKASGSYTFCRAKAQKYVEENKDLIREMCSDFCNQQQIMKYWFNDDYKAIDVCLRCYVLGTAIDQAVNGLESQYEDEIWKAVL